MIYTNLIGYNAFLEIIARSEAEAKLSELSPEVKPTVINLIFERGSIIRVITQCEAEGDNWIWNRIIPDEISLLSNVG